VEGGRRGAGAAHPDLGRQGGVEGTHQGGQRDGRLEVEVGGLAGGVDPGVGASGAHHGDRESAGHGLEGRLQLTLHGAALALSLPAAKGPAEVGDDEFHPLGHRLMVARERWS
jgi:hypothetical protein